MTDKIVERTTLQFTDLTGAKTGCTTLGSNKFWKAEVVDHGGGMGSFLVQWGSTGTAGSTKGSKERISLAAAQREFLAKKASKVKKGYTEVITRTDDEEAAKQKAAGVAPVAPSAPQAAPAVVTGTVIHPKVEALLATIYGSTSSTVRSGLSSNAGSTDENPIGNLSDSQLDKGGDLLDQIQKVLESEFGHESSSNKALTLPLEANRRPRQKIIDLTSAYLSNVPRALDRSMRGPSNLHKVVISSYDRLEEQRKFLQLLRDAHLTQAVFQQAARATTANSKATVWYDGLGCEIEHLDPGSADFKWVKRAFDEGQSRKNSNWFRGSTSRVRLVNVFKFTRNGTMLAFDRYAKEVTAKPGATGRIFAWHGTRTPNLLGIGKSGLLMPENLPRGVHISGKAFGRGIYHAPNWTATNTMKIGQYNTDGTNGALKSMNYTGHSSAYYGGSSNSNVFMFLQEVALGTPEVRHSACWDQHRPQGFPKNDWIYANAGGCSTLTHDEVVTFHEDAQVFRYLCEITVD